MSEYEIPAPLVLQSSTSVAREMRPDWSSDSVSIESCDRSHSPSEAPGWLYWQYGLSQRSTEISPKRRSGQIKLIISFSDPVGQYLQICKNKINWWVWPWQNSMGQLERLLGTTTIVPCEPGMKITVDNQLMKESQLEVTFCAYRVPKVGVN